MDEFSTIERAVLTATPEFCAEIIESEVADIKRALKPDALHIKLGAHSRELDVDTYKELVLVQHLKTIQAALSRLQQVLGLRL